MFYSKKFQFKCCLLCSRPSASLNFMAGCSECKKTNAKSNALSLTLRTGFVNRQIMDEDVIGGITIKKSFLNNLYYKQFRNQRDGLGVHGAYNHALSNEDFSKIRAALATDRSVLFGGGLDANVNLERLMWRTLGFPLQILKSYDTDEYSEHSSQEYDYYEDSDGDNDDNGDVNGHDNHDVAEGVSSSGFEGPKPPEPKPRFLQGLNSFEHRQIQSWDIGRIRFSTIQDAVAACGYSYRPDMFWLEVGCDEHGHLFEGDDGGLIYFDFDRRKWTSFHFNPHKHRLEIEDWGCEGMAHDRKQFFEDPLDIENGYDSCSDMLSEEDKRSSDSDVETQDWATWSQWQGWSDRNGWQGWKDWSGRWDSSHGNSWQDESSSRQWTSRPWRDGDQGRYWVPRLYQH